MFTHTPHAHVRATFEASAAAETRSASCRHSPAIISDLIYARIRYVRVCVCVCVICHISKLCGALQLLCIRSTCSATPIRRPHFDRCQQLAAARPTVSSMIACAEQVPAHQKPTCWWVTQVRQQKTDDGERVSNLVHTGPRNMRLYPACAAQARQQTPRRLRPCVQYVLILLKAR